MHSINTRALAPSPIGTATRAKGKIRFTPALGSSKRRTIVAYLARNGNVAPSIVVGHYNPGTLRPGRAARIAIRHSHGGWRISWRPGALATAQQLTIRFADGVQALIPAKGGQRIVTRFALIPREDGGWIAAAGRHWNIDRPNPR